MFPFDLIRAERLIASVKHSAQMTFIIASQAASEVFLYRPVENMPGALPKRPGGLVRPMTFRKPYQPLHRWSHRIGLPSIHAISNNVRATSSRAAEIAANSNNPVRH